MADHDLIDALSDVVGRAHVRTDPGTTEAYVTDWSGRWRGETPCVVRPRDTAEVAAVVAACAAHDAAIVPQGGNTGLVGGSVPRGGEVVLSLVRLDDLEPVDTTAAQVTVGAGVTLGRLHAHARAAGFAYGVDLAARDTATVGGTIATNAGGVRVVRHGATRQQVVGLEAVLADGSVFRRLTGLVKDNVGYDLPGLFVGSEGTLGVVTRARVRLVTPPAHRVTALVALDGFPAALALLARLRTDLDAVEALEYVEHDGVELVVGAGGAARPFPDPHPAYVLIEVAGPTDPTETLAALVAAGDGIRDAAVAVDGPSRGRLWQVREGHTDAIAGLGVPHKLDLGLPLGELAAFRARLDGVVASVAPGARTIVFGHLGDGNLHVNVVGPDPSDERVDRAVFELVAAHGGSISAEHGVGVHKVEHVGLGRDAADLAAMAAVKRALDPDGRMNPGVLFPAGG